MTGTLLIFIDIFISMEELEYNFLKYDYIKDLLYDYKFYKMFNLDFSDRLRPNPNDATYGMNDAMM